MKNDRTEEKKVEYLEGYTDELLQGLKNVELELLKKFDEVCMKYQINYSMFEGSAIGTVRHKGMIPWDDDVDVMMLREDYAKLKQVPAEEWGDTMELIDPGEDRPYHYRVFPRLYKKGTTFNVQMWNDNYIPGQEKRIPIYIDIFLFDYVSSKEEITEKAKKAKWIKNRYYTARMPKRLDFKNSPREICSRVKRLFLYRALNLRYHNKAAVHYWEEYLKCVRSDEKKEYVAEFDGAQLSYSLASFCRPEDMFPPLRVPFENITVSLMKNYDAMLKEMYPKFPYMELPPEEGRYCHPPALLNLGDGKGDFHFKIEK